MICDFILRCITNVCYLLQVFFFLFLIKLNIKKLSGKLSKLGFLGESLSECNIYGVSCIGAAVTDE